MAGDDRTPEKTIGEVKYAELKHAEERHDDKPGQPDASQQNGLREDSNRRPPNDGDNRTPDKTIGEVKYARDREASKDGAN